MTHAYCIAARSRRRYTHTYTRNLNLPNLSLPYGLVKKKPNLSRARVAGVLKESKLTRGEGVAAQIRVRLNKQSDEAIGSLRKVVPKTCGSSCHKVNK